MKILLIGPPASGKGTIGRLLADKLNLNFLSTGDILRSIKPNHPLYEYINSIMNKGELLPSDITAKFLIERVSKDDCKDGYVLDGWGRKIEDINCFNPNFDVIIFLSISDESVIKRVTGRRYNKETGETINIYTLSNLNDKKDLSNFEMRNDDNVEVVNNRLKYFYIQTMPVIEYFKKNYALVKINAEPLPQIIVEDILNTLKEKKYIS